MKPRSFPPAAASSARETAILSSTAAILPRSQETAFPLSSRLTEKNRVSYLTSGLKSRSSRLSRKRLFPLSPVGFSGGSSPFPSPPFPPPISGNAPPFSARISRIVSASSITAR